MANSMRNHWMKITGLMGKTWKLNSSEISNPITIGFNSTKEFLRNRDRRGLENQPIDELTKRMKVDVPHFYGKMEPHAFENWLIAIKDYFDWFAVSED